MIQLENRLPADDSHEIACFIRFVFSKLATKFEFVVCCKLYIGGALTVSKPIDAMFT